MPRKRKTSESKGFGRAFKRDIGREVEVSKEVVGSRGGSALFMNPTRRDIFALLCSRPGLHLSGVARELGISVPTARWHLAKLAREGFVTARTVSRRMVHYPAGMLEEDEMELLALLNEDGARSVYTEVLRAPGLSQKDLTERLGVRHQVVMWHAGKLVDAGVLTKVGDGRYRRYYPTALLEEKDDAYGPRIRHFREELIRLLKRDGVEPEVVRAGSRSLHLRVTSGTSRKSYRVPTRPFSTVLGPAEWETRTLDASAGTRDAGEIVIPKHHSRRPKKAVDLSDDAGGAGGRGGGDDDGGSGGEGEDEDPSQEGSSGD